MSYILSIETSGNICSVALSQNENFLDLIESAETNVHAEKLAPFIQILLERNKLTVEQLSAIAVSEGPGSYTGLRIGISLAKGMCYALGIPLIAIDTLKSLAYAMKNENTKAMQDDVLMPMIDARRMEVYTASFNFELEKTKPTEPIILDESFYNGLLPFKRYFIAGSGAQKAVNDKHNIALKLMPQIDLSAKYIAGLAWEKFENHDFADLAYFEPVYLKEFALLIKKQ